MAFENLKQALTNTPILAYPRNEDSFILVDTPSSLTTCPKYVTRFWKNLHFLEFNFKLACFNL
jgi:hypothetical protein